MAEYKVNARTAKSSMGVWAEISGNLDEIQQEVRNVRQNLSFKIKSRQQIDENLRRIIDNVGEHENDVKQLHNAVSKSIDLYTKTENDIIAKYGGAETLKENNKTDSDSGNGSFSWIDSIFELVSEYGVVGGLIGTLYNIVKDNKLGILSNLFKSLDTGARAAAKIIDGVEDPIKYIFGYSDPEDIKGFKDAFFKQFDDYHKVGGTTTTSKVLNGVGVAAKWLSGIVSLGINAHENYNEFKNDGGLTNPRLYGEMIVETAVDILAPAVVAASIAALVGCTGGTAALIAPFVVWGINSLSKFFTDGKKDLGEHVSNFVFDKVQNVGDAICSTWENITTKWQIAFS